MKSAGVGGRSPPLLFYIFCRRVPSEGRHDKSRTTIHPVLSLPYNSGAYRRRVQMFRPLRTPLIHLLCS